MDSNLMATSSNDWTVRLNDIRMLSAAPAESKGVKIEMCCAAKSCANCYTYTNVSACLPVCVCVFAAFAQHPRICALPLGVLHPGKLVF